LSGSFRSLLGSLRRPTISRRNTIIILALASIFSVALIIRSFSAKYGFFLNEFDPYYDYRAASFIVTSFDQSWKAGGGGFPGLLKYFSWIDYSTWFPEGRNVAPTSQDGLQFAGALIYIFFRNVLGLQLTLYDFLVLFPVFLGALTAIVFYFLVKKIAGEAGGLFAALIIAVSPPLIERGNLGWFKSEPLALLLFALSSYLLLTLLDQDMSSRQKVFRALIAGLFVGFANTSWGGALYFSVAFGLFFVILPFLDFDISSIAIPSLLFTAGDIFASAIFPRPGVQIVTNPAGFALLGGTVFLLIASWLKSWVKPTEYRKTLVIVLFGFLLLALSFLTFGLLSSLSKRYLSAIAPWERSGNPLVESVAEHFVPTGGDYFSAYLILLFISIFGAAIALRRRSPAIVYALVIGISGLYISAAFSRLLVYSSLAMAFMAGIGFSELAFSLMKPSAPALVKRKTTYTTKNEIRTFYSIAFIALLAFPATIYWIPNPVSCTGSSIVCDQSPADSGVSLTNGGTIFSRSQLSDWSQALQWLRDNTPKNAVVIAWWDYGYWITVMGNRTSVADNATLNGTRIANIGRMFMSNTTQAASMAKGMAHGRPVYVLLFITGSLVTFPTSQGGQQQFYVLQIPSGTSFAPGGGDESKKQWFIRIGGLPESKYLEAQPDDFNLTPYALQSTLFAHMLPFTFAGYYNYGSQGLAQKWQLDQNGNPPLQLYSAPYRFQFPAGGSPFRIAFTSSSLTSPIGCGTSVSCFSTILIYQVV
jgi:dolichyl-diphosphooligosaccharide--protein glycosyltransferase